MSARLDLATALRRLEALGDVVRESVRQGASEAANRMAAELGGLYPQGPTGNLRRGLRVEHGRRGSYVLSRARHAHLYEWGTRPRKNYTRQGANRGVMPAAHVFVPNAMRARDAYIDGLTRLIADVEL